jgi:acetyltransferase EpsM
MKPLILIGGGGHARVVLDAARSQSEWEAIGYLDAKPTEGMERAGLRWLGDDEAGLARADADEAWFVLGIGSVRVSDVRERLVQRYGSVKWATVVHASARIASDVRLGAGTVVFAGAVVNPAALVGDHCVINTGAIVEHDCIVGDHAQVGPGAVLGGGVTIAARAFVGLGSRVRDHVAVGEGATVGMGAVVVKDVAAGAVVLGVPARDRNA